MPPGLRYEEIVEGSDAVVGMVTSWRLLMTGWLTMRFFTEYPAVGWGGSGAAEPGHLHVKANSLSLHPQSPTSHQNFGLLAD